MRTHRLTVTMLCAVALAGCGDIWLGSEEAPDQAASSVAGIAVGALHSCAISQAGKVYCWGANDAGAVLGEPSRESVGRPTRIVLDPLVPAPLAPGGLDDQPLSALSAGGERTCVRLVNSRTLCWGDESRAPRQVADGQRFVQVAAGAFSCGLRSNGTITCWSPRDGTLHDVAGTGYRTVDVGGFACALQSDSLPVCWPSPGAAAQAVASAQPFATIDVGGGHACGLTAAGEAFCWGSNVHGQLGDSTRVGRPDAASIVAGNAPSPARFRRIALGDAHTCGLTEIGTAYCWGLAENGQLGYGFPVPLPGAAFAYPRRVNTSEVLVELAAGQLHVCALSSQARVLCWGDNHASQLGFPFITDRAFLPVEVEWSE